MRRLAGYVSLFALTAAALPSSALAYQSKFTPVYLHMVISASGLAIALILLLEALRLRKIFLGGAIAEKIHFVILGIVCLAASAVAKWTMNFVTDLTFEQVELAGEMLVLVAMALFSAYFYSVGSAMNAYLKGMQAPVAAPVEVASHDDSDDGEATARG